MTWFHVSPHRLAVGEVLVPGGGESPDPQALRLLGDDTGTLARMPRARRECVWLTPNGLDALFWASALRATHIYEVEPLAEVLPWNGTGLDGWVTTSARIIAVRVQEDEEVPHAGAREHVD